MLAVGTNGHVSFIVPISTNSEQSAAIFWNGTPAASNDWTMDISGHNSASWSDNGGSQLQFIVAETASLSTANIIYWGIAMRRGDINANHPFTASFHALHTVQATNADFGLRVVHRGGVAGNIESWYDPTGKGLAWTLLDTLSMTDCLPGMNASNTFTLAISPDTYYGPIAEGDIWAGNFRITNSAIGSPLPQLSLAQTFQPTFAIQPTFANLILTTNYQLQVSGDLNKWTNQGSEFTATNSNMVYPQYWNVDDWSQLFFRLVAP